ncbi:hypothetical protein DFH29DRAFT_1021469 [Suillus ampliporus]|nr:hypothetical protein DFH29DRAFT_1021469 [Suillus ampliporus]
MQRPSQADVDDSLGTRVHRDDRSGKQGLALSHGADAGPIITPLLPEDVVTVFAIMLLTGKYWCRFDVKVHPAVYRQLYPIFFANFHVYSRHGAWLHHHPDIIKAWIELKKAKHLPVYSGSQPRQLVPVIKEFKDLVTNDSEVTAAFTRMMEEGADKHLYAVQFTFSRRLTLTSVPASEAGTFPDLKTPANMPQEEFTDIISRSQGFITAFATCALIFIESVDPRVGLMCFVGIGLGEVSTCEITVSKNDRVSKGDEIGMFHFGGSTHCLIFGPDVDLHFVNALGGDLLPDDKLVINSKLADVIAIEPFGE